MSEDREVIKQRLSALTPAQRALLARRLNGERSGAETTGAVRVSMPKEPPRRVEVDAEGRQVAVYPASNGQQRMWFMHQYAPDSPVYCTPTAFHLRGSLQVEILEAAFQRVIQRHESLRTTFAMEEGELVQRVASSCTFRLEHAPSTQALAEDQKTAAQRAIEKSACLPFDLAAAPPFRVVLVPIGHDEHLLLVVMHHIITDGWSLSNLCRELSTVYAALASGAPVILAELPVQYADYSAWQRRWLENGAFEGQATYWKGKLAGEPGPLDIPSDRSRPAGESFRGGECSLEIDRELISALKARAQERNATLYMILLAAFKVLLHRYTGQTDLLVGVPIASRQRPEVEGLIGLFANTLVMRTEVAGDATFEELLARVKETALEAYEHQDMPFELLVRLLEVRRDTSRSPLFQVTFALRDFPEVNLQLAGLEVTPFPVSTHTAKFDLSLAVSPTSRGLTAAMEFNSDLFSPDLARQILEHWHAVMLDVAVNPVRRLSEIPLLSPVEKHRVLEEWNRTERDYPRDKSVEELFEEQAERTPEAVAVECEGQTLTYGELNARANQLARHLRKLGVGPDTLVGICVERSLEMVVGLLGILKAGGAYVPLDPKYPKERLAFVLEDAAVTVLLTQAHLVETMPACGARMIRLDADGPALASESGANAERVATGKNLAYVIYTSGSTGVPKGVEIGREALMNFLVSMQERPGLSDRDILVAVTTFSFDIAGLEIFLPLVTGARLVLLSRDDAADGFRILHHLTANRATVLQATPSTWRMLLDAQWPGDPRLKMLCGGEALPGELADRLLAKGGELWNMYGPTETTIWSSIARVTRNDTPIHIGRPIANTQLYILDAHLQPVPLGVPGELHIGGAGLARGYHHRPGLTAEKFIASPFSGDPQARLYKTGDLARFLPDGNVEHLGRLDHQVKIRGFRIELGEIEEVLNQHPGVRMSVVAAREDTPGDKRLVAYVISRDGTASASELREHLRAKLPDYMVPAAFVTLEALPLTPNGKVDRKALPPPDFEAGADKNKFVAPGTPTEIVLAGIWREVLGLKQVGIHDSFFELGGHSLLAIQMRLRITSLLHVEVPLRWLFEHPTIGGLAKQLESAGGDLPVAGVIEKADREKPLPMSFVQQQMWLVQQVLPDPATYNLPVAWQFSGGVDREKVRRALQSIQERHEVLRTALVQQGENLVQRIVPAEEAPLPWREIDLRGVPPDQKPTALKELLRAEARGPFDLAEAPLWRAVWIDLEEDEQVLAVNFHHGIADEWSVQLFFEELAAIYAGDGQAELPELPVQYADYSAWQRRQLTGPLLEQQRDYWTKQLLDLPPVMELPADRPRPVQPSGRGANHEFELIDPVAGSFRALAVQERTTLFTVMLAAFQVWLYRYTGQADLVVGTPIANRERPEVKALLGSFLNTLPMRARLEGSESFVEVVRQVRETVWEAFGHARLPFGQIVELAVKERNPGQQPLYQVMFVLLEEGLAPLRLGQAQSRLVPLRTGTSKNDLTLDIQATDRSLACRLQYATDLFSSDRVESMARHLTELFRSLTDNPEQPINRLNLLPEAERRQIVLEWNRTERDYPRDKSVEELFEEQATKTPEAVAVECEGQTLTYGELNARANQLARHLRKLGVGPDTLVGICVERSLEMVVGLLGILKAGGAYVPLDPKYPKERLAFVLEDAAVTVLLTQAHLVETMPACGARMIRLDADGPALASESGADAERVATGKNLAYVIYTSGSTGVPKGVEIGREALMNFLVSMQERPGLSDRDILVAVTTFSFDIAGLEIFLPLVTGARLVLLSRDDAADGFRILHHLTANRATVLQATPSTWRMLLDAQWPGDPRLKMLCGGEALPGELADRLLAKGGELWNMYGPTETTIWSSIARVTRNDTPIHIGRPIANTQLYILDAHLQPVPLGVPGELHIGGAGLARGYHHRPGLTAEKFIASPFSGDPQARLYKTGDLARFLPDGNVEHLGRLDHQVKIRGFRIELGEIEEVLNQHPGVRMSVVAAREDTPGDKRLVAYVISRDGTASASELREHLRAKLPDYMVPAAFVTLEALPLTPNGKVDRKALPPPDFEAGADKNKFVAPGTPTEIVLAGIWREVLGLKQVGIHDSFFELGGHSLLAIQMRLRITSLLHVEVPLRWLFEHPTIGGLAKQLESAGGDLPVAGVIEKADREKPLPMSFVQQQMWLVQQVLPDPATYNLPVAWQFSGGVDREKVRRALQSIQERHEVLRTALVQQGENLVQRIVPAEEAPLPWREIDLRGVPPDQKPTALKELLRAEARGPFDLAEAPLWRAVWIDLEEDEQVLAVNFHHGIADEWSVQLFFEELAAIYAGDGQAELPELPVQYADYSAWQRRQLTGPLLEQQRDYWTKQLLDLPPVMELPVDRPRPIQPSGRGANHEFELMDPVASGFRALAVQERTTLFTVMLAAFQVWLYRYTGQADLVVGTPIANRERPEVKALLGSFLNTLPMRARLEGSESFVEVVRQVRETVWEAFGHARLPFGQIVELAVKERNPGQQPLYQVMFVLLEEGLAPLRLGQAQSRLVPLRTGTSKNDLTLDIQATDRSLACRLQYATDLFSSDRVESMARHLTELFRSLTDNPEQPINRLNLLPEAERRQIVLEWNRTERDYPRDKSVEEWFEEQAERTPEAVAVECEGQTLTYGELNARANQLAAHLRKLRVQREEMVAILLERSVDVPVAVMGVLKAGGAFVPLVAELPQERIDFILRDTKARVVLTQTRFLSRLSATETEVVCLDGPQSDHLTGGGLAETSPPASAQDLAYVIYTSGSTGQPKGVEITRGAIALHTLGMIDFYRLSPADRMLHFAALGFDAAIEDLLTPLLAGARVVLRGPDLWDPATLTDRIRECAITVVELTPLYWHYWLAGLDAGSVTDSLGSLRVVSIGGDAMPVAGWQRWNELGLEKVRLINMYGPTEATISAFAFEAEAGWPAVERVPIGKPLVNRCAYILDQNAFPVGIGMTGELYLGGEGIARGYLNRPELTAESFLPDPFSDKPGARLYRTGDLARYLPDGNVEFLGRVDHQVKIRGFRIELGEIEEVLNQHPGVRTSVVAAREDTPGDKRLVAYVISRDGAAGPSEWREHLRAKLPDYMVPAAFVILEALPLTPNGKVDRKALPPPDFEAGADKNKFVAPGTPTEIVLAGIWREVLDLKQVGIHDNFFELGGHSLLAVLTSFRITSLLHMEVPLRWLLEHPTIEGLAKQLESAGGDLPVAGVIEKADREKPLPMSFAQQQMWLLHQMLPDPATYNQSVAWQFSGGVDREKVRRALQSIQERHEVLRTALVQQGENLVQRIVPAEEAPLPWREIDLRGVPPDQKPTALKELLRAEARGPFDLAEAPLWRAVWIDLEEDEQVLAVTFHHGIADEWSVQLFFEELEEIYTGDGQAELPELPVQYADYSAWQRRQLTGPLLEQQRDYWTKQLLDLPPVMELPVDRPRPIQPSGRGANHEFELMDPVASGFRALAVQERTTLFTVMLAAFQVWLYRYTGQADLVVGTPIANRERPEVKALLGYFLNTLPMRARLEGGESFVEVVRQVRETVWEAVGHAKLPFEQIVELAVKERNPGQQPLYQVMFVLLEEGIAPLRLGQAQSRLVPLRTGTSKNDLSLSIRASDQSLACQLQYATDLFSSDRVESMARHLTELFRSLTDNPEQPINQLNLLPEAERRQIVLEWNRTERDYPRDKGVEELFEEQAQRTPEAVAVECEGQTLTYGELNARANQLAAHLRKLRVQREEMVAILLERSVDVPVAVMGVLKAGGAFVPLVAELPQERIDFILRDTKARVVLTQTRFLSRLSATESEVICLDEPQSDHFTGGGFTEASPRASAQDLAYVIYTSGSTGQPKGVEITRGAIALHTLGMIDFYRLGPADRMLHFAALGFDVAIEDLLTPLLAGARVVLRGPDLWDPATLTDRIRECGITVVDLTPLYWHYWLAGLDAGSVTDSLGSLRVVSIGGDAMPVAGWQRWNELGLEKVRLINMYGPTEATISAFAFEAEAGWPAVERVPIGKPLVNRCAYILDQRESPVGIGMTGELYLGGEGIARGYLNRPELTAESFLPDPFSDKPGARLYRTGDLARYLPDGNVEFLGRVDHQVKIRGFRIELGEIEEVLNQHPGVRTSVVAAREDTPGDKRLVAYVISRDGAGGPSEWREHLRAKLPDYMVPAAFVILESLPLTPNGKVDRKALPPPDFEAGADKSKFVAPGTPTEIVLAGIWREVLDLKQVGIHDNFFELGGHSMRAVQLIGKINKSLIFNLSIPVFFQNPTIQKLAMILDQENHDKREPDLIHSSESATRLVTFQSKGNRPPLFFLHSDWAGGGLYCGRISQQLGEDQPFYALPPYRSGKESVLTMEEMVAHHLAVLREHTPHGPYLLGGYCIGATVAVELARQLVEQGEEVPHLILLDPTPHRIVLLLRSIWLFVDKGGDILKWDLLKKIHYFDRHPVSFIRWSRLSFRKKVTALCRRLGFTSSGNSGPITVGLEADDDYILDSLDYAVYFLASCLHSLKPLSIPTTVYFPEETPLPWLTKVKRARETFPIVTVESVPGNHHTCITQDTSVLAGKMKKILGDLSNVPAYR